MAFPLALTAALDALLEGVSRKDLAARAEGLSAAYRKGQSSGGIVSQADALAYALARMPATFAVNEVVLARLAEVMPDIAVTLLDRNAALRALAAQLLPQAKVQGGELSGDKPRADLVIASYVLAELPEAEAASAAVDLWRGTDKALVLVEPGTPQGFARIRSSRAALIEAGAHIAVPCTHDNACPLRGDDWCHFSQRLARSREHMQLKAASVPFEDERYSYVVAVRKKVASGARILAPVLEAKPGPTFKLCDETGLHAHFIPARDKAETRRVRRKGWGDLY